MKNIAIFASGTGTNAENLIHNYKDTDIHIVGIYCNKPNAGVISRAENLGVPVRVFSRADFYDSTVVLDELQKAHVEFVILAGFLWLLPKSLVVVYPDRIINIHPALLPAYGGKGMFGHHVHEAVIAHKEKESGITIHLVNEHYDDGKTLFQKTCPVLPQDTAETLAARVHELEYTYFPQVVKDYIYSM